MTESGDHPHRRSYDDSWWGRVVERLNATRAAAAVALIAFVAGGAVASIGKDLFGASEMAAKAMDTAQEAREISTAIRSDSLPVIRKAIQTTVEQETDTLAARLDRRLDQAELERDRLLRVMLRQSCRRQGRDVEACVQESLERIRSGR